MENKPYIGQSTKGIATHREDNPIVYIEISTLGGRMLPDGSSASDRVVGRMYFELRMDIVPICSTNFLTLISGELGQSAVDGVLYHYKGTRIHRILKDHYMQGGDLLNRDGDFSRGIYENGLFADENFLLTHAGPGCLSYCNRGPDTNGSLFQISFRDYRELDDKCIVFGSLASEESYKILEELNVTLGSLSGEPLEDVWISDCGVTYP